MVGFSVNVSRQTDFLSKRNTALSRKFQSWLPKQVLCCTGGSVCDGSKSVNLVADIYKPKPNPYLNTDPNPNPGRL